MIKDSGLRVLDPTMRRLAMAERDDGWLSEALSSVPQKPRIPNFHQTSHRNYGLAPGVSVFRGRKNLGLRLYGCRDFGASGWGWKVEGLRG